ncbi:class I SAM-dependent methyltransferase [Falsiroseomonas sp. E2-1-a20]|uniref:class I SAM-dependent methyltransferase n=1 Tax=Falsiroseomonas sp. E2-1-a20 TaxID=3239300 RepID=UPI003F3811DE
MSEASQAGLAPAQTPLDLLRRRLPAQLGRLLNRAIYEAAFLVPTVARSGFFNSGYLPLLPGFLPVEALPLQEASANLYHYVLHTHPGEGGPPPRRVLDIGCGSGGGLIYAAALWPEAMITGVDCSFAGIAAARRRVRGVPNIRLLRCGGHALPLPDQSFDLAAGVGSLTNIGAAPFLAEAARVLRPGGILSISAGTGWSVRDYQAMLATQGRNLGLRLISLTDITAATLTAIDSAQDQNEKLIASLPRALRRQAREWATLPGSARHARYGSGARRDLAAVFRRDPGPA